jgi:hypothetical protein
MDETHAQVQARIGVMIASGKASRTDEFVIFAWRSPAESDEG